MLADPKGSDMKMGNTGNCTPSPTLGRYVQRTVSEPTAIYCAVGLLTVTIFIKMAVYIHLQPRKVSTDVSECIGRAEVSQIQTWKP